MLRRSGGAVPWTLLLVLALFLATPGVVLAGGESEDSSNHAAPFLRMGAGTRILAMGGAGTAAALDATAGYWNPAALGWTCGSQICGMHALGMEEDRRYSFVAGSHRMEWGALGASFLTAGMSDIDGRDESGNSTGSFNYGDLAFMIHGAYATDIVTFGGTLKYLRQGLSADVDGDDAVSGYGFDLGAGFIPYEWMRVGIMLRDFASKVGSDDDANKVPLNLRAGIALMPLEWFTFAFDLDRTQNEGDLMFHTGVEGAFPLTEDVGAALRLGLNDGELTAGLGVQVSMLEFNYAFMEEPEGFLGESHRIGVTLKFGDEDCPFDSRPRGRVRTSTAGGARDRDLDGIPDKMDACPTVAEDFDGFEDTDGCPDVDNDGDGILDVNDKCPDQAEDFDGFQDSDGCPDPDNDGDGIRDIDDRCPDDPETFNRYRDLDGCPDTVPIQIAMVNITFMTGSAEISGADPLPALDRVVKILKQHPEVSVRIIGHTDNVGGDAMNMDLSKRRAGSVKTYLVSKGIESSRLTTEGRGKTMPIDSNDTAEGRARNRRIEFEVID